MNNNTLNSDKKPKALGLSLLKDLKIADSRRFERTTYETARIRKGSILVYTSQIDPPKRRISDEHKEKLLEPDKFNGFMTPTQQKKIRKILENWITPLTTPYLRSLTDELAYQPKFTFITLTLVAKQMHTDKEVKSKMLNTFLIWLKESKGVENYIWRAEAQQNGNIHFHIICDKQINWKPLRQEWNNIQNRMGYIEQYRKNMLEFHKNGCRLRPELFKNWSEKAQRDAYKRGMKENWSNPNSTDIHEFLNKKNPAAYLAKYCGKNQEGVRGIEGRLWSCSCELGRLVDYSTPIDSELHQIIKHETEQGNLRCEHHDDYTIYLGDVFSILECYPNLWFNFYSHHLKQICQLYKSLPEPDLPTR